MENGLLLIVGPPGTGKTRTLLGLIRRELEAGLAPELIAFVSFTRAAVREGRQRAVHGLAIDPQRLIYWGTIHSLCFKHLGLRREHVMVGKRWKAFCEAVNMKTADGADEPTLEGLLYEVIEPGSVGEADVYRAFWDWARNKLLSVEQALELWDPPSGFDWRPQRALFFVQEYERYKKEHGLWDFTDMLLDVERQQWAPPVRLLVVDEAQDLTPLQRKLIEHWIRRTPATRMACDPDQAIYSFAGAEPDWLVKLQAPRKLLQQSHRVPDPIARSAQQLIRRNVRRIDAPWRARSNDGVLLRQVQLWHLDEDLADPHGGTWYFLARNRMYLDRYSRYLHSHGIPYQNLSGPSPLPAGRAVRTALQLAWGEAVSLQDVARLAAEMRGEGLWERGAKAQLQRLVSRDGQAKVRLEDLGAFGATPRCQEVLSDPEHCLIHLRGIQKERAEYLLRVAERYGLEALMAHPWVTVGTYHAVKGGEADHVIISPEITARTRMGYEHDPEPERRVFYVAMTRARRRLFVLEPRPRVYVFDEL